MVERFLHYGPQKAANLVNDLLTSRLHQFENTAVIELPTLFDDFNLDTNAREALHAYVVGLQDWVAGILDWHRLTGRYNESALRRRYRTLPQRFGGPTGLDTSAARIRALPGGGGIGSVFEPVRSGVGTASDQGGL